MVILILNECTVSRTSGTRMGSFFSEKKLFYWRKWQIGKDVGGDKTCWTHWWPPLKVNLNALSFLPASKRGKREKKLGQLRLCPAARSPVFLFRRQLPARPGCRRTRRLWCLVCARSIPVGPELFSFQGNPIQNCRHLFDSSRNFHHPNFSNHNRVLRKTWKKKVQFFLVQLLSFSFA